MALVVVLVGALGFVAGYAASPSTEVSNTRPLASHEASAAPYCKGDTFLVMAPVFGTLSDEVARNLEWAQVLGPRNDHLRGTTQQYLTLADNLRVARDFIEQRLRECYGGEV